jgi:hypothetical protein
MLKITSQRMALESSDIMKLLLEPLPDASVQY